VPRQLHAQRLNNRRWAPLSHQSFLSGCCCGWQNQAGAGAIGPALFGETNRWGRLPVTIYGKEYQSQLTIEQMHMRADVTGTLGVATNNTTQAGRYPGRGYRYYTGRPLFAAFAGLSYTSFNTTCTSSLRRRRRRQQPEPATGAGNQTMVLNCEVENTGRRGGDAVVLLFHRPPQAAAGHRQRPVRRLLDFDR
jgi:hypothetical protein